MQMVSRLDQIQRGNGRLKPRRIIGAPVAKNNSLFSRRELSSRFYFHRGLNRFAVSARGSDKCLPHRRAAGTRTIEIHPIGLIAPQLRVIEFSGVCCKLCAQ